MNSLFLLMARHDGQAVIPLDRVCADYMHLTLEKLKRKQLDGEIDIPLVRLGANTQKTALGVHFKDLANYIDRQREKATREHNQLMGRAA
ncbi:pyocin activator PrtN family protein [Pseudomonas sp. NPDC089534]|uniref:pyocin activator PrtN family protein n=1 Tax=Pseudomonas sp. NPDC089534 TaxID=3364468 RepID=UPI00381A8204